MISSLRSLAVLLSLLAFPTLARAGLYYSGEGIAELPSQWRGFLLDQRALRNIAVKANATAPPSPMRLKYEQAVANLEKTQHEGSLTADERADLGALYLRLGRTEQALQVLRAAYHDRPNHFRTVANLGTAWQVQGDLEQAAACLQQAVRLAPGKLQRAEEYQLKLVRLRQRRPRDSQELDDLFGVRFVGASGRFEPGKLAAAERKKLPSDAAAVAQQLALWLPADGRLLWQLAELANAQGDVRTAAAILDGCVTEFGLRTAELRRHRRLTRAAADELANAPNSAAGTKAVHSAHASLFRPRSNRPLLNQLSAADLPPIQPDGITPLPWAVLAETTVGREFKPNYPKYLKELEGKKVTLSGFMQPLGEEIELGSFLLIEYPVGCWYCEMPELSGIVLVQLPPAKTRTFTRGLVKVEGTLKLNPGDPETFLYTIQSARVAEAD